ncbi:TPA: phosphatidylserine decarboxylase [Campylobacter coli]|nr:phosphatidylserine decarboxylase [Campylobacter coli]HEF1256561.1 phosphatidylserine decarboxylase [Campylobacter coli]HEH4747494.1 phosphatidylserine decarboxylase [Campylobacter coli]
MGKYIAKEGQWSIAIVFILFIICWIFYSFSILLFLLLLVLLFIFRIPNRTMVCNDSKAILSPIDGRVTKIENVFDKRLGESVEISIKNAFYDAGTFCTPFKMDINDIGLKHGLFLCSELKSARIMNEKVSILASSSGTDIILRVYAGSFDRKLKLDNLSYNLEVGDKMGFLVNGAISIVLPKDTRIHVGLGDELKSGSLLGYLA